MTDHDLPTPAGDDSVAEAPAPSVPRRAALARGALLAAGSLGAAVAQAVAQPAPAQPAPTPRRFAGKAVLITGATSGIGATAALAFAREGARVAFCGRREALGAEVAARVNADAQVRAAGGGARYARADVRVEADVRRFVEDAAARFGRLDVAFNNAGKNGAQGTAVDTEEDANWDDVFATNLKGVWYAMKYEIPVMRRQRAGAIVNTASLLGLVAVPTLPAYIASKHGVVGLTKSAAVQYAGDGIRVNAVAPGPIDTPLMQGYTRGDAALAAQVAGGVPVKRMGRPEEIAQTVLWLASDAASYVHGSVHVTDGGKMARESNA